MVLSSPSWPLSLKGVAPRLSASFARAGTTARHERDRPLWRQLTAYSVNGTMSTETPSVDFVASVKMTPRTGGTS